MYSTVRIGQVNIFSSEHDRENRYERLADHLVHEQIEIVTIQEVSDKDELQAKLSAVGFTDFAWAGQAYDPVSDLYDGCAVASKIPMQRSQLVKLANSDRNGVAATIDVRGTVFHVAAAHFAWGSTSEGTRLNQAEDLDSFARAVKSSQDEIVVAGVDLNATPESRTYRFLRGFDVGNEGQSTHWTDAFLMSDEPDEWETSNPRVGTMNAATAKSIGIFLPELLPSRRIDYLLVHDWRYGKVGSPVAYHRFGDPLPTHGMELSDHYGIWADLLLKL